jgi:hypothetical protein
MGVALLLHSNKPLTPKNKNKQTNKHFMHNRLALLLGSNFKTKTSLPRLKLLI